MGMDRRLRRSVGGNAKHFRAQLGRSDALVCRDFTLQLFERQVWQDSDMEINVHEKKDVAALGNYLIELEDYTCAAMLPYHEIHDPFHNITIFTFIQIQSYISNLSTFNAHSQSTRPRLVTCETV